MIVKVNAMSYAKLIKELQEGDHSVLDLAEITGLHYTTIRDYVNALHKECVVHISGFVKDSRGRDNARLWAWGDRPDAKHSPVPRAKRQKRLRDRQRFAELLNLTP